MDMTCTTDRELLAVEGAWQGGHRDGWYVQVLLEEVNWPSSRKRTTTEHLFHSKYYKDNFETIFCVLNK